MIRKTVGLFWIFCASPIWACSFHAEPADLYFELGSTALTKSSKIDLEKFVVTAKKFHYIDFIEINAYAGYELISFERLENLVIARSQLIKTSINEFAVANGRIFATQRLPTQSRLLHPELEKNARAEVTIWGWRSRPIEGKWCGIACPCFEEK